MKISAFFDACVLAAFIPTATMAQSACQTGSVPERLTCLSQIIERQDKQLKAQAEQLSALSKDVKGSSTGNVKYGHQIFIQSAAKGNGCIIGAELPLLGGGETGPIGISTKCNPPNKIWEWRILDTQEPD